MIDKKYIENFITNNFNQLDYYYDLEKLTNKINNIIKKDIVPSKINDPDVKKKILEWSQIFRDKDIEIELVNVFKVRATIGCCNFIYGIDYSPDLSVVVREIYFIKGISKKVKDEFNYIKKSLECSEIYLEDIVFRSKEVDNYYNNTINANKEIEKFCNENKIDKKDIYSQIFMKLYNKVMDKNVYY